MSQVRVTLNNFKGFEEAKSINCEIWYGDRNDWTTSNSKKGTEPEWDEAQSKDFKFDSTSYGTIIQVDAYDALSKEMIGSGRIQAGKLLEESGECVEAELRNKGVGTGVFVSLKAHYLEDGKVTIRGSPSASDPVVAKSFVPMSTSTTATPAKALFSHPDTPSPHKKVGSNSEQKEGEVYENKEKPEPSKNMKEGERQQEEQELQPEEESESVRQEDKQEGQPEEDSDNETQKEILDVQPEEESQEVETDEEAEPIKDNGSELSPRGVEQDV